MTLLIVAYFVKQSCAYIAHIYMCGGGIFSEVTGLLSAVKADLAHTRPVQTQHVVLFDLIYTAYSPI